MRTVGAAWIGLQERHARTVEVRYDRTVDMQYARTVAGQPYPPPPTQCTEYQISRSVIEMHGPLSLTYPPHQRLDAFILEIKSWGGGGLGWGWGGLCIIHIYLAVFIASDNLAEYTNTALPTCSSYCSSIYGCFV
jgi:hypothetical protein